MCNQHHSGILKRRFPYVVHMRINFDNAVKVIMAAVVLHNIAIEWKDEIEDLDEPEDYVPPRDNIDDYLGIEGGDLDQVQGRLQGQAARDNLRRSLLEATENEMERMERRRLRTQ